MGGAPPTLATPANNVPQIQNPAALNLETALQQFVIDLREDGEPENTKKAYLPKLKEWFQYCDHVYPTDPYKYNMNFDKIYLFMFFQTFRQQKKRGGNRQLQQQDIYFDAEAYDNLMRPFAGLSLGQRLLENAPHVENPISESQFATYKAALRRIYNAQINNNVNSLHWDHVWLPALKELQRLVKSRKVIIKRLQHQEKVTGEFSPYAMVGHYNDIEDMLWTDSNGRSWRQTVANLRHRYCLLFLTSGILRCESLIQADLSDHLSFYLPQRDQDIHPMLLLIMQIPEGKVNNGRTLFGRATRHKLPQFCPVGALAMYLQCRFHVTREFNNFTIEDWCTNSRWFDIKLLVDVDGISDRTQPMRSDGYSKHIKETLLKLGLPTNNLCHLGRKLGTKTLELLEEESESIRRMGQWNPSVFDNYYSTKLPIGSIRKLAGYISKSNIYYNTRTTVNPNDELLKSTPIGSFVYTALDGVLEQAQNHRGGYDTAIHFLRCLAELNKVFLQDAAALLCVKEERSNHFMFQNLAVLESQAFYDFKGQMASAIRHEVSPLDATIESVLPGVLEIQRTTHSMVEQLGGKVDRFHEAVHGAVHEATQSISEDVTRQLQGLCNHLKRCLDDKQMEGNRRRKLARCFRSIGELLDMAEFDGTESDGDTRHLQERTVAANDLFESEEKSLSAEPFEREDQGLYTEPNATSDTTVAISRTRASGSSTATSPNKRLAPKYHSLKEILDDWQDPNNGFLVLDKKYGRNWRKDWSDSQKTLFSRLSRIYSAVVKYIESNPDHNEALAELEEVFKKKRLSIRGMVRYFQAEGYIHVQKSRGRTKQQLSADDAIEV
ncbi:centromere DNA-binding like protein [Nitzschia inconspicua]|uniref:Centromere DNA-binding like protein n=1 Tax=Nitzschia inconspicua TaxID=303405 RepID=A0A9K3L4U6_9STRA|nr:centromere DNA-binding like protein [Nitzschia inconspicua]KAG7354781.1 centromere DNA-binding like protein [Nitzschia inconspicua]